MSIYIKNTLTGEKEEFVPIKKGQVSIYVCGPTVYDESHIGHVRSALVFEVIRKYFKYRGYKVKFVKNITDIDDKIINAANKIKDGSEDIMERIKKVTEKYEKMYHYHMGFLGIKRADIEPKATKHIVDMINMVQKIIDNGYAYESDGNIYFSVKKYKDYGKLSGQDIDKIGQQRRLSPDELKKDDLDFVLWKKSQSGEPSWDSPWGKGRPGWHIECSVMSTKYLGPEFDIHCGGRDLIFPHHENEIAQAEASDNKFANYWVHNGLLSIEGEKMSKSLGNFITVEDILKQYTPDSLNILFLSTHYSKPLDFTWDKLKEAEKSAEKFGIFFKKIENFKKNNSFEQTDLNISNKNLDSYAKEFNNYIESIISDFESALDDNFNTASALSKMFDLLNFSNKFLDEKIKSLNKYDKMLFLKAEDKLKEMGELLCLFNESEREKVCNIESELLDILIHIRNLARKEKMFDFADIIREKLESVGIILEDTSDGTKYRIKKRLV